MSLFHAQQGISPGQILSLVGSIIAPLTPSIPIPPPQRWGRLIRAALARVFAPQADPWLSPLDRVALNPQPLPPRYMFLKAVAQEAIAHAELLEEFTSAASSAGEPRSIIVIGGYVSEFADDFCGNGFRLAWPHPGPPPPWFPVELSGVDLLVLASQFAQGAGAAFNPDVREALQDAAARLAEVGVSRMQEQ
jgi:hypothetical protein